MRRAARTDDNQGEIVKALRKIGAGVTFIHRLGDGIPDLLVSFRQKWFVMEVKDGSKVKSRRSLTDDELQWISKQKAPVYIIEGAAEAVDLLLETRP